MISEARERTISFKEDAYGDDPVSGLGFIISALVPRSGGR